IGSDGAAAGREDARGRFDYMPVVEVWVGLWLLATSVTEADHLTIELITPGVERFDFRFRVPGGGHLPLRLGGQACAAPLAVSRGPKPGNAQHWVQAEGFCHRIFPILKPDARKVQV